MDALITPVGCYPNIAQSTVEPAMCLTSQRCGLIRVGNRKGLAATLGYLPIAMAEGEDIFGYRLAGTKFKTILLTSPAREALIRKKFRMRIAKLEVSGYLKIVNSSILSSLGERPSSRELSRCLDDVLGGAEVVIVDGYGLVDTTDYRPQGFAPTGYEGFLADYLFAAVAEHVSTIFVGQGDCAGAFKHWDPLTTFDHEVSLYRFDKKTEPLSFLVHWVKGLGASAGNDVLMVSWREEDDFGVFGWQIASGIEASDPLLEFAIHLRYQGMSYQRIGDLLGLGRSTVHRWLTKNRGMTSPRAR